MNVAQRQIQPTELPRSVTTLVPDRLYAVGGFLPAEKPLSWLDPGARGFLPIQCYVLRDRDDFFMIDTGLVGHQEGIKAGIAALIKGATSRRLVLSRREPDTMMNMIWLVREFGIQSIQCAAPADPFDMIEKMDEALTNIQVKAMLGVSHSFLMPGVKMKVGSMEVESIRPGIRVLLTDWFYESTTRSLFTSDSWAFLTKPVAEPSIAVKPTSDDLSVANIKKHLKAKFDWLCGIDTAPVVTAISSIMQERQIDRVCPYYGCVIEGADAVKMLLDRTVQALAELANEPARQPLGDFSWPESRRLLAV